MKGSADVVVIGAGIIGLNAAYQIARRSNLDVVVVDKARGVGEGSTGASSAVCRFRYTRPEVIELAKDGIGAYRHWQDYVKLTAPRARFHHDGVLWLSNGTAGWAEAEQRRLGRHSVATEVLSDADLADRFPALNPCVHSPDFATGRDHECSGGGTHLLETEGGYMDPVDAAQDLVDALGEQGSAVRFSSAAERILVSSGKTEGVRLEGGEEIGARVVINATGAWCIPLFRSAGLDIGWPLEPTRIQVVHIARPQEVRGHIPVCVDPAAGIYFRLQNRGQQIIVSSVREEDEQESVADPDEFARYVDDDFAREKLFALQHRIPALSVRDLAGYSGLYTINRADVHPIVGRTEIEGLFAANGCSGHGFKLAPAIGAVLARMIVGESSTFDSGIDLGFLAPSREPIELESKSVLA